MAWATSDRRQRLPKDWTKRRVAVLKRDGYRCRKIRYDTGARCASAATDVDHILPGDDHSLGNLQSLCRWHHDQKTAQEAAEGRRARYRPSRRRPEGAHPAEIS